MLEYGVWRADQRGLLLALTGQHEGTGVRASAMGNAHGGNPDHHRSKVPLLRVISPHTPDPASTGPREDSHLEQACMSL